MTLDDYFQNYFDAMDNWKNGKDVKMLSPCWADVIGSLRMVKQDDSSQTIWLKEGKGLVANLHPGLLSLDKIILHNHNCFELAYMYRGSCTNYFENERFLMKEGDILLLNPSVKHEIRTSGPHDILVNLIIEPVLFEKFMSSLLSGNQLMLNFFASYIYNVGQSRDYLYFNQIKDKTAYRMLHALLLEYCEQPVYWQNVCESLLSVLLSRLSMAYSEQIGLDPASSENSSAIIDILSFMREHCVDAKLETVAKEFNYSPGHITRLVKQHTGKTFIEVMQNFRLEKVKQYLVSTDLSAEKIARLTRYNDVSYLYKLFKKKYGLTLSEYRHAAQQQA